jgi:AcrR family transcriptional regulator
VGAGEPGIRPAGRLVPGRGEVSRSASSRPYRMQARAAAAARTADSILAATARLWREHPVDEITLELIAEQAGVSVRTVIRRFGSKTGVFASTIEEESARIAAERNEAPVGDVEGALDVLLRHYERDGEAVLRTLAMEEKVAEARMIVERGRAEHRGWCDRVFGPRLPEKSEAREARLDALVAGTDLYIWKLLRRDLGRSLDEVKDAMRMLVEGVLDHTPHRSGD